MDSDLSITFPTTSLLYPAPDCFLLLYLFSLCYTTTTNISMGLCKTHRIIPFFLPPQVATTNKKICKPCRIQHKPTIAVIHNEEANRSIDDKQSEKNRCTPGPGTNR